MNLQLTTIGSFKEAQTLIDALNKLDDKRLASRITRRFHNYYHKSFYLHYRLYFTDPENKALAGIFGNPDNITKTEFTLKLQDLFVTTYTLGPVHKKACKANIPYLYLAAVSKLHYLKMASITHLQPIGNS
jgi:hypothetical protein